MFAADRLSSPLLVFQFRCTVIGKILTRSNPRQCRYEIFFSSHGYDMQ